METDKSTDQSNRSIDSVVTLNETINRSNDMIISIPSIIILTLFIIFLSYTLRQKNNHQSNKVYTSGRLMQLNQQNSFKEAESVKFTRSKSDTQTSASEVKPLRNMSEESELSRSVMASTSSEREDESGLQRKKSLMKKKKH